MEDLTPPRHNGPRLGGGLLNGSASCMTSMAMVHETGH
jgi:hypothetical protein